MSTVYRARDTRLERDVAIKLLSHVLAEDATFVERFKREAQAAAGLNHRNIVAVYDWGAHEHTYFIAMEHIPGSTLKEVINRRGARPEQEALEIAAEVASALAAAHARGVVHRDVKPHNILLDPVGSIKVADFGIARAVGATALTDTGTIIGSASYASPEQIQRGPVDARSDLYSLGAVLFELLAGKPPFTGDSAVAIAWQHVHETPPDLATLIPSISSGAAALVAKALAKNPADRFQTASEMHKSLVLHVGASVPRPAPALLDETLAMPISGSQPGTLDSPGTTVLPAVHPLAPHVAIQKRRWPLVAMLAALLAALPLGAVLAVATRPDRVAVAQPVPMATTTGSVLGAVATQAAPTAPAAPPTAIATAPTAAAAPPTAIAAAPTAVETAVAQPTPAARPSTAATIDPSPPRVAEPVQAPPASVADAPAQAVLTFYANIGNRQLDQAAGLWSSSMQTRYPPATNVYGRFDQTLSMTVHSARVISQSGDFATVAVELSEVIGNPAVTRRWAGTWRVVRTSAGWLLDEPSLQPA